jgi:hypothetical protein
MAGQPPFLFLHIPRTAGTTFNGILERNFPPEAVLSLYTREDFAKNAVIDKARLDGVRLIQGHVLFTDYDALTFYDAPVRAVTFLREPVSRVISEYFFLRTWPQQHLFSLLTRGNVSLADYVAGTHKLLRYKGSNFMTRVLSGMDPDSRPEAALARAKANLRDRFAAFGLTADFDASLLLFADVLGLTDLLYERRNSLRRPEARRASPEERALVAARNTLDAALYRFAEELFAARVAAGGRAFASRLARHKLLVAKYQKVCNLLDARTGLPEGEIDKPKG